MKKNSMQAPGKKDMNIDASPSLLGLIPPERIALGMEASGWKEAVRIAGSLLVDTGLAEPRYIDGMIRTAEELGPYIVIAPQIALPHARPEDGALGTGLCLVKLSTPVNFGHPEHDPVSIIFGLVAIDKKVHVRALQTLAEVLSTKDLLEELKATTSVEEIYTLFARAEAIAET